ncbi:MAG: autotransporter-associated beta strand repeat-containing protein [Verrucomicrobiota bacterium]
MVTGAATTLSGNNTYSGNTTTSGAGTLNINSATAISSGRLIVASGGTINNTSAAGITLTNNNNITLLGNSNWTGTQDLSFGSGILTGGGAATVKGIAVNGSTLTVGGLDSAAAGGGFSKTGSGALAITGAAGANVSGNFTASGGTLILGNKSALGSGIFIWGSTTLSASTNLSGNNSIANAVSINNNSNFVTGNNSIEMTGGVSLGASRSVTNSLSAGNYTISGSPVGLSTIATANTLTLGGSGNTIISSAIQNNAANGTATSGFVIYTGNGTLTLSGINTYNGTTTQSGAGGTLNLTGSLASNVSVTNGSFNQTSAGSIGGSGVTVTVAGGSSSLTLGGNNTYTGNTTLTSGTLNVNHASALGTGAGTLIINGGALDNTSGTAVVSTSNNPVTWGAGFTFGTALSTASNNLSLGNGSVSAVQSSTMTFAGNGTTLTMGALSLSNTTGRAFTANGAGNTLVLGGLNIMLTGSGVATSDTLAGTANITINGVIANGNAFANGIVVTSTGTTTFSGNNTYTGTTIIGATGAADVGTLRLSGAGKISSAATTVYGGVLDLNGTTQTVTTLTLGGGASGSTANVLLGAGALNLGGNVTYTATNNPNGASITGSGTLNLLADRTFVVNDSIAATADLTVSAVIANGDGTPRGLTKTLGGTLVLSGNNTYTGTTTVTTGTLIIDGNQASSTGNLSIAAFAILGGSGTIGGEVTVTSSGILAPGTVLDSTSTLTLNNTNLIMVHANSKINLDITGTAAGTFDNIVGINSLSLAAGSVNFTLSGTYTTASWDVLDFASKSGNFSAITLAGSYTGNLTRSGETWTGNIGGQDWTFAQTTGLLSVVPEPSTWALLAFSLTSVMILRRRRNS